MVGRVLVVSVALVDHCLMQLNSGLDLLSTPKISIPGIAEVIQMVEGVVERVTQADYNS